MKPRANSEEKGVEGGRRLVGMKSYSILVLRHDKVLFDGSIGLAANDGRIAGKMVYAQRGNFR